MIILRLPPYPINITYDVPLASTNYLVTIENSTRTVRASQVITSSAAKKVTLSLAGDLIKYDHDYSLEIYKINTNADTEQNIVVQDMLTVIRPYVNPNTLGTTATEIAEAKRNENIARALVDSFTGRGFTFERKILEVVGQGTDYIPVWDTIYKVNQVFENGKLVYDITNTTTGPALDGFHYEVTKDRTSIVKVPTDSSYYDNTKNTAVAFPEGFDYIIDYDAGYKVIPHDVQDAVEMIINDLKCGRMDHYKSYVTEYETDQFKIKYDSSKFVGTGNMLVDTALSKYITNFRTPGML